MNKNNFIFLTFLIKLIKCHQAEPQVELYNVHISEISSTSFNHSQIVSGNFLKNSRNILHNSSTFSSEFNPVKRPQPWLNTSLLSHLSQALQTSSIRGAPLWTAGGDRLIDVRLSWPSIGELFTNADIDGGAYLSPSISGPFDQYQTGWHHTAYRWFWYVFAFFERGHSYLW